MFAGHQVVLQCVRVYWRAVITRHSEVRVYLAISNRLRNYCNNMMKRLTCRKSGVFVRVCVGKK